MTFFHALWILCFLKTGQSQYYGLGQVTQNYTLIPYPYQNNRPTQEVPVPNQPTYPSYSGSNGYPFWLAEMGIPRYQNPMGYQGYGAYPPMYGMPFTGNGLPQIGGGMINPQLYGEIMGYPSTAGFQQQAQISKQLGETQSDTQRVVDNAEIIDVSPELQRKMLGWPEEGVTSSAGEVNGKPRYTVDVDTQTTNQTIIPHNLSKPYINEKKYVTTIRKSFVYDSKHPEPVKPVNIHIINGQQVTTTPPPETTVNENVEGITSWYTDDRR